MARWLVILSLALAQWPAIAAASPKPPDPPLWKKLLAPFTPMPRPRPGRRDQAPLAEAVVPPEESDAIAETQVQETVSFRRAGPDCNDGKRVVSTYYWQGRRTASGESFNPRGMTAAHRTLPFGTRLNVSNPKTGKSVVVIINDRGPFVSGVGLDLSLGAAQAIGMRGTGTVCIW
jgi:rare lipoprotein A